MSLLAPVLAPCPQCGEVASDQQSVPGQLRGQVAGAGACVVTTLHTGIAVGHVRLSGPRPVPAPCSMGCVPLLGPPHGMFCKEVPGSWGQC